MFAMFPGTTQTGRRDASHARIARRCSVNVVQSK